MGDTELVSLSELSDGAVRPWYLRDDDRRTRVVYGVGAVVVALFGLVFSFLLGSVDGGIRTLVGQNRQALDFTRGVTQTASHQYYIVSWCPCGRTLPAGTFTTVLGSGVSGLPLTDQTCDGCFDNLLWSRFDKLTLDDKRKKEMFPKTDYDHTDANPSVRSFIYQMKKHNLTDEVIIGKCGWRTEGSAYYAYGQEEIDVRMCVVEEFLNHMAKQGWVFTLETWYAQQKDMIVFIKRG